MLLRPNRTRLAQVSSGHGTEGTLNLEDFIKKYWWRKEENIGAWLNPDPKNLEAMQAILEDRARPYYEYGMAA